MNFCVLYGSYREPRLGIRLANYLVKILKERRHEVNFLDAREINLPIINKRIFDYKPDEVPEILQRISKQLYEADGFVLVAGEYNYSIQPGLKNLLDHFYKEYFHRPAALATYSSGSFGGIRSGTHLLGVANSLSMPIIPSTLSVPRLQDQFAEEGVPNDPAMADRVYKFINHLEWYARALKAEREKGLPN
jgi:NAD(P)H-dependent FMN reductase